MQYNIRHHNEIQDFNENLTSKKFVKLQLQFWEKYFAILYALGYRNKWRPN